MSMKNISDLTDKFQRDFGITDEELMSPASVFALALVDKNGNVIINGSDLKGTLTKLLAQTASAGAGAADGLGMTRMARATFDPSAKAAHRTIGAHGLGVFIPDNAIITRAFYEVLTTFTSATDAATIALHAESAGGLLAALAISDASNMFDAGIHAGKPGFPNLGADAAHDSQVEVAALVAATFIKLTAKRELTATVAVEALTAGKMTMWVEYVQGD